MYYIIYNNDDCIELCAFSNVCRTIFKFLMFTVVRMKNKYKWVIEPTGLVTWPSCMKSSLLKLFLSSIEHEICILKITHNINHNQYSIINLTQIIIIRFVFRGGWKHHLSVSFMDAEGILGVKPTPWDFQKFILFYTQLWNVYDYSQPLKYNLCFLTRYKSTSNKFNYFWTPHRIR